LLDAVKGASLGSSLASRQCIERGLFSVAQTGVHQANQLRLAGACYDVGNVFKRRISRQLVLLPNQFIDDGID
jgi:hypothetical protein